MLPTDQSVDNVRKEYPSINPSEKISYRRIYIRRNLSVSNKQFFCSDYTKEMGNTGIIGFLDSKTFSTGSFIKEYFFFIYKSILTMFIYF